MPQVATEDDPKPEVDLGEEINTWGSGFGWSGQSTTSKPKKKGIR